MRGNNPAAADAAEIANRIVAVLNADGAYKPHATLYLGKQQRWAVSMVEAGDPFLRVLGGIEVVWVSRESYVRCV